MTKPTEPKAPINYFGRGLHYQLPETEEATQWFDAQWTIWEKDHPDDVTGEAAYTAFVEQQRLWELEQNTWKEIQQNPVENALETLGAKTYQMPPAHSEKERIEVEDKGGDPPETDIHSTNNAGPETAASKVPSSEAAHSEKEKSISETEPVEYIHHQRPSILSFPELPHEQHDTFLSNGDGEKHQVRLTISKSTYNEFYRNCRRKGRSMSSVVEQFMHQQNQLLVNK